MKLLFSVGPPQRGSPNSFFLVPNNWDDYSFKTTFRLHYVDASGDSNEVGTVKIGFIGQNHGWTRDEMDSAFTKLPDGWFSLGQDVDYYKTLATLPLPENAVLKALNDVAWDLENFEKAKNERVFNNSLLRGVSLATLHGQYRRVINGETELTEFHFGYAEAGTESHAEVDLKFQVKPASMPSTNIHVIIGRNGVGKTTLLNNMVNAIVASDSKTIGSFYTLGRFGRESLPEDYFSSLVSVSFSAFDPFIPPVDQPDRAKGVAYFYVGMKKARQGRGKLPPKDESELSEELAKSIESCLAKSEKAKRWVSAIRRLESDSNFADMNLTRLAEVEADEVSRRVRGFADKMSSGHSIVLLTITRLVDTVEEKTLVLMDEPESHLHPPLLSAFTRALSDLLHDRNAVAIIASHSPVIVQEVPKSCVWKLIRIRASGRADRPERETFGENVGVLTREIFGLEVSKSGFHDELQKAVDKGGTFDEIMEKYDLQLGFEAQAILRSMIEVRAADERS